MKPPLELTVTLRGPGGQRFRLSPDSRMAGDRPLDLSFSTEAGEGFTTGQITLRRQYDQEFPDLALLNEAVVEGHSGDIAYEGRTQGTPRSLAGGGPEIRLDCQGPMSLARSQPFTDLLIDRDLSQWGPAANLQIVRLANAGFTGPFVAPEIADNEVQIRLERIAQSGNRGVSGMAQYRAPVPIGRIDAKTIQAQSGGAWKIYLEASRDSAGSEGLVHVSSGSAENLTLEPTGGQTHALVELRYEAPHTEDNSWWYRLRPVVIGTHGLTQGTYDDALIPLSDAIGYLLGRYAPQLDTSQIVQNHYPVPHAVWREPVTAHDAVKQLNVYSQWALGAWENRRVQYEPFDLSTYDWEVQAGIDGVEVETQGVTVESAYNGVTVTYTDWAGVQQVISPDQAEDLRDLNPAIAANQWGERAWTTLQLSNPQTMDSAITIGRLYLADLNRPKFPSTITVPGHIRDRTGAWQPTWKVRANQTISIRNHPNDHPRLITGTSWSNNQLQITTDNALNRMEAILGRLDAGRNPTGGN